MRNAYYTVWHPTVKVIPIHIIKIYPLAFMFAQEPYFCGLPNLRMFLQASDELEADVPVVLGFRDNNPVWPALAQKRNLILIGGNSFGLIGRRD